MAIRTLHYENSHSLQTIDAGRMVELYQRVVLRDALAPSWFMLGLNSERTLLNAPPEGIQETIGAISTYIQFYFEYRLLHIHQPSPEHPSRWRHYGRIVSRNCYEERLCRLFAYLRLNK